MSGWTVWGLYAALWVLAGAVVGYFFIIIIELSTRLNDGRKFSWAAMTGGWLVRTIGIGVLLFFAVRQDAVYAILFVAAFTIVNSVQVARMRRLADRMDPAKREAAPISEMENDGSNA